MKPMKSKHAIFKKYCRYHDVGLVPGFCDHYYNNRKVAPKECNEKNCPFWKELKKGRCGCE